ncbi:MAG: TonB-dependent receptor [Bacteroidales bacterium]|nr:TonB-dependent receptor [Bacteroidales bacterium]
MMFSLKDLSLFLLGLFCAATLTAQNIPVSGVVMDSDGAAVAGATIVVKGSNTNWVVTDTDGRFSLNAPSGAVLIVSCYGYETQEVPVSGESTLSVVLGDERFVLDEAVAIGYGTVRKSDLTGAVSAIDGTKLAAKKNFIMSQALQGSVAGVTVTRSGSLPGGTGTVRVRGITTINTSDPLVIIDGIPGDLNSVNPNDVESMSVLKDAASASIYGNRAAAGVIIITTKRARSERTKVDYSFEYGLEKPTTFPEFGDATRYMRAYNEMVWNASGNVAGNEYNTYSEELIKNYSSLHETNPDQYPDTDWKNVLFNKTAPRMSHLLSVTGGGKSVKTKANVGYDTADALYDGRTYKRYTVRINNDIRVNDLISAAVDVWGAHVNNHTNSFNPTLGNLVGTSPLNGYEWSDGRMAKPEQSQSNFYANMKSGGYNDAYSLRAGGKVQLNLMPFDGMTISGVLSPEFLDNKNKSYVQKYPVYLWDSDIIAQYLQPYTSVSESRTETKSVTYQVLANYLKDFGDHHINLMAGYEAADTRCESLGASRSHYEYDGFPYLDVGPKTYMDNSGTAYEYSSQSYFGRVIYNYKQKYLLQFNGRYDGSSRFSKGNKWGFFPSASVGYVLSEENYFKNIGANWLNYFKIRGSYGTLGNDRIGNYPYQSLVAFGNTLMYDGGSKVAEQNSYISSYAINDISWETTRSWDIGFDARLFDNHLSITADVYDKITSGMLLQLAIPDFMGFSDPYQNAGKMRTKGWELEIGWNQTLGDFSYSAAFNIFDSKSVMGDMKGTEFLGSQVKMEGSEFNEWYGFVSEGLYQTQEEVENSAVYASTARAGDIKYKDISGPDGVPDGKISSEYDRVLLGGSLPRYQYGLNLQAWWKNLDFTLILQGVGKWNCYKSAMMVQPFQSDCMQFKTVIDGKYWSNYNTASENLKAEYPRLDNRGLVTGTAVNYLTSDFWLFNGAYLRIKNVSLGYSLPEKWLNKVKISSMRIYASASDLFSFDRFPAGWDPEGSSNFINTAYVFGFNIGF